MAIAWIGDVVPYERRQPVLARYISGQILGIVFGQAAGGMLGELIGWRATLVMLGALHIAAGLLLLSEMRRLGRSRQQVAARALGQRGRHAIGMLRRPWVRILLVSRLIEGIAMFGALAYVGAELHQRFGISLGVVGAMLAAFGAGALFYSASAGTLVPRSARRAWLRWRRRSVGGLRHARPHAGWPGSLRRRSPSSGSASTCCTTRCRPTPHRWRREARGLAISLFALVLFAGSRWAWPWARR